MNQTYLNINRISKVVVQFPHQYLFSSYKYYDTERPMVETSLFGLIRTIKMLKPGWYFNNSVLTSIEEVKKYAIDQDLNLVDNKLMQFSRVSIYYSNDGYDPIELSFKTEIEAVNYADTIVKTFPNIMIKTED